MLISNTLVANTARSGGGVYLQVNSAIARYNRVISNTVDTYGGGFFIAQGNNVLDANDILSNTAQAGGGVSISGGTGNVMINNVIARNQSGGLSCGGDGMCVSGEGPRAMHNTFVANSGSNGICVRDSGSTDGQLAMTNTIIVSHTTGVYVDGGSASLESTLWYSNTTDWSGAVTDTHPITESPDFVDAAYHIGPASAGLNQGAIVDVVSDIDGDPRPADSGYDVGADERPGVSLRIAKSATPIAVNPGEYVTYTVVVSSVGVSDATFVALTDTLPAEVRVQSADASQGACTPGVSWGATVTCALGTLSPGARAVVTLTVDATTTVPSVLPARLRNVAVVQAAETLSGTADADSWLQDCNARLNDDPTDYTTVQAAVDAATQDTDVVKVAGACAGVNTYGGLRQHVYLDKTLAIRGGYTTGDWDTSDPVAHPTVLDALELGRVIYISGTVTPTLEGLHIQRGDATGLGGYVDPWGGWVEDVGGGVYGQAITLTLDGCWIEQSRAGYGGGVYLEAGAGTITATTFATNTANNGGGLYLSNDSVALMGNSITANTANSGGGLYLDDSDATLSDNTVTANTANSGAGLYLEGGVPTLSGNTISSNTARFGGGLYTIDDYAVITGNVIVSNTANNSGDGGGLYQSNSHNTVSSNTIAANFADGTGGGACMTYSSSQYDGNQFSNNTASAGGGAYVDGDNDSTGPANFMNNTFVGNTTTGSGGGLRLVMGTNTISGNVMISNTARRGGGAYLNSMILNNVPQPIYITGNTAMSNTATQDGGGFYVSGPRPHMDRNQLVGNTADQYGGGLYVRYRGYEPFNNTVIADNYAGVSGGGMYVEGASPRMQHTTLARNISADDRAVYLDDYNSGTYYSHVVFSNTILVSSTTGIYVDSGNSAILNSVLWYSVTTHSDGGGAITVTNAITGDPAFDLDGYHLTAASQALDQGIDAGVMEDIDGQIRPMGFGFDLGADEYLAPTLLLDKRAFVATVDPGATVTYTVVFTAAAGGTVHNVTLTDTLDGWQQPLTAISSLGGCALTTGWGGGAVCTIGDMPVGTTVRVTLTAQVSPTTPLQQQITNDAVARGDEAGAAGQTAVYVHFCRARINDGTTDYASIQAAVDAASDGDLVKVAGGLCLGASERGGEWQHVHVTKTVTLRGGYETAAWTTSDPDGNPTRLDAMGQGRVFYIAGDIAPVIEGFHITGGDGGSEGGGVYVETASATLNRNHVYGNQASYGGGIYLDYSAATLDSNVVSTNTAATDGAGLYLDYAPALLSDNQVFGNVCPGDYCDGGGLYLYRSDATLNGNAIFSNTAGQGGGLYAYYSDDTLEANTITSNTVSRDGGGVLLYRSSAVFARDIIRNNVSDRDGGGVFMTYTSIPHLTNTVIADNQAASNGSGIYNDNALPRIVHTTIARNTGGDGTGVYIATGTSTALTNTIIVSQATGVLATGGTAATINGVLWFSNTIDTAGSITVTNAYTDNPIFAGDGYHLQAGSPAIDQGLAVGVTEDVDGQPRPMDLGYDLGADEYPGVGFAVLKQAPATFVLYDQPLTYTIVVTNVGMQSATGVVLTDTLDGWQQADTVTASQGGCAITAGWGGRAVCTAGDLASGAAVRITLTVQISPSVPLGQVMVNTLAAAANETANGTQISVYPTDCRARINADPTEYTYLQDAVDAATAGDLIKVMGGTCVGINTDDGLRQVVYLDKQITIRGGYNADWTTFDSGANPTVIDAQGGGRALYATGSVNPTLEGLRFVNGDATSLGGSPWGDAGGGVYVTTASPIFSNTHILNGSTLRGGGLYLQDSNATFYHSQFYSNTASVRGGAVYAYQGGGTFNDCRFYSNTATSTGGGVYLNQSNITFNANFITANTSDEGGGVYLDAAGPRFYNTVIADNRASVRAGALYASASSPRMWHTTIARNTHTDGTGVYATDWSGTYSNVAMTNTILVSQSVGIEVNTGSAATLDGVLWFGNTSGNTSGPVTVQNATTGDPAFAADGYHLTSASQAIDRGVVSGVGVDVDGDARPQNGVYDLGADEYVGAALPPVANFTATPTSGTRPLTVTFTDQSVGSITTWLWRFGDGVTSAATHPTHTYTQTGIFTASLRVTGPGGSDTLTRTNYVTVTEPSPQPPDVPALLAPSNGTVTTTQNVTLRWQPGTGGTPTGYNVRLDGVVITSTDTSSATVLAMGVHTWTVRAFNMAGYSDWASEWRVEVTDTLPPPDVPVLLAPSNGTVTTTQNVTLRWQPGMGGTPTGYNVRLDGVVITSTDTSSATVLAMGVHTWTVRAFNMAGYSDWASEWRVEVDISYRIYLPLVLRNF
ncbi:MAG: right-handed parallel beta-helix repeat-containing protein [Chloroflexota bacterium]|nr:right-handed parallel beta-helix repeat-containing protein [Chloroflexota bacterium]